MSGKEESLGKSVSKSQRKASAADKSGYVFSYDYSPASGPGNVLVICRFRPLNQNELNHGGSNV